MKLKPIYMTPIFIVAGVILISGCVQKEGTSVKYDESSSARNVSVGSEESEESNDRVTILKNVHIPDKMALWTEGTKLRGANIFQRKVYPELDGPEFMGLRYVGPPLTQDDFNSLAELGANLVVISHAGLFDVKPPYSLDREIQANLDRLLGMIAKADMFAVIAFRTGPGRSEFTFYLEEVGDWFDESYLDDSMWENPAAQDSWVKMWRYTAGRYQNNPIVVGYHLMVEPNSNEVFFQIWEPDEFYDTYADTSYDWNELYPRIVGAIREVDPNTPIIVGGMGYSAIDWLPYLEPTDDARTVYAVHQYAPVCYTHQWKRLKIGYPGVHDVNWDGRKDEFDKEWIDDLLGIIDEYVEGNSVPVAITEFGLMRWEPGADRFMDDQMALLEKRGINHALWVWDPSWEPWTEEVDAFNFRHGPDKRNHREVASSDLISIIRKYWERNTLRPSSFLKTRD